MSAHIPTPNTLCYVPSEVSPHAGKKKCPPPSIISKQHLDITYWMQYITCFLD